MSDCSTEAMKAKKRPAEMPSCHKFVDRPHAVIMILDQEITCAQASEIGKSLGQQGLTARFVSGGAAEFGMKYAEWMKKNGTTWQA